MAEWQATALEGSPVRSDETGDALLYVHDDGDVSLKGQKTLRDDSRGIEFRYVGGGAMGALHFFRLTWGDRVIPVEAWTDPYGEGRLDRRYSGLAINGRSPFGFDIPAHPFADPSERREAELIAAECLLAYGGYYSGLTTDHPYRVQLGEEEFQLADFGYPIARVPGRPVASAPKPVGLSAGEARRRGEGAGGVR